MSWKHDYNFFPNNASFDIIDIVHLIKYNLSPHHAAKKARKSVHKFILKHVKWQK
jgi:hypothetical protein